MKWHSYTPNWRYLKRRHKPRFKIISFDLTRQYGLYDQLTKRTFHMRAHEILIHPYLFNQLSPYDQAYIFQCIPQKND